MGIIDLRLKTCRLSTTIQDIESFALAWKHLLDTSSRFSAFSGPLWTINTCLLCEKKPFVVSIWENDQLKAVLPLVYSEQEKKRIFEFPNALLGEWLDIVSEKDDAGFAALAWDAFMEQLTSDDEVKLINLSKKSLIIASFSRTVENSSDITYTLAARLPAPYIDIAQGWSAYLDSKTRNFRIGVRTLYEEFQSRQLSMANKMDTPYSSTQLVDFFLASTLSRFKEKSVYFPKTTQRFTQETYPKLMEAGMLSTYVLTNANQAKLQAFTWEANCSGKISRILGFQLAYDESLKNLGIARFLMLSCIERACQQKATVFDLGRTTNDLKERLKTDVATSFGLTIQGCTKP